MELSKTQCNNFLLNIINRNFRTGKMELQESDVFTPLTSVQIGMDGMDMFALYTMLTDFLNKGLWVENPQVFWCIDSISEFLIEKSDIQICTKIIEELEKKR